MYHHSFTHETFDGPQWAKLRETYAWLMWICPDFHDAMTSKFPEEPLRFKLKAWHKLQNSSGAWETSTPSPIDHDDPEIVMWEGQNAIMFHDSSTFDPFVMGQFNSKGWKTVDTGGKPYDLLVCTMLILAKHLFPETVRLKSNLPVEHWGGALSLARQFDRDIDMPEEILPRAVMAMANTRISPPSQLDFRA